MAEPTAASASPDPAASPSDGVVRLLPALREAADRAARMLHGLGAAATVPGPDGGWTPVGIVLHLAAVDAVVWTPRLRQLAAHEHPTWPWTEPDPAGLPEPSPEAAAEAFLAARGALLSTVSSMDEPALRSTGIHAVFGELDAAGLLREVMRHDAEHLTSLSLAAAAQQPARNAGVGHG